MKKTLAALLICAVGTMSAAAYETDGSFYFGPYVGYKSFDDKKDFKNGIETGLKAGFFLTEHWAAELAGGYVDSEEADGTNENIVTPGATLLYHFKPTADAALRPYLQAGYEARIDESETDHGFVTGFGAKYFFNKHLAGDLGFKNIYYGEGKHDQLVGATLALFFGVQEKAAPAPVAVVAPVEPAPAPIVVEKPVAVVVVAPVDSDGDGVNDDQDLCPNTPKGYVVDEKGCFKSLNLLVNFGFDSNKIQDEDKSRIAEFAEFLKENPVNVEIQGHTDSTGPAAYNQKLSEERAKIVGKALVDKGVAADSITTKGYGESKPAVSNDTKEGRAQNRRIEAFAVDNKGNEVTSQKPQN
jgi:OOP family OmpA-OmpF porin